MMRPTQSLEKIVPRLASLARNLGDAKQHEFAERICSRLVERGVARNKEAVRLNEETVTAILEEATGEVNERVFMEEFARELRWARTSPRAEAFRTGKLVSLDHPFLVQLLRQNWAAGESDDTIEKCLEGAAAEFLRAGAVSGFCAGDGLRLSLTHVAVILAQIRVRAMGHDLNDRKDHRQRAKDCVVRLRHDRVSDEEFKPLDAAHVSLVLEADRRMQDESSRNSPLDAKDATTRYVALVKRKRYKEVLETWNELPGASRQAGLFLEFRMRAEVNAEKTEEALRTAAQWQGNPPSPRDRLHDRTWQVELMALRKSGRLQDALNLVEERLPAFERARFNCGNPVWEGWECMHPAFFCDYLAFLTAEVHADCCAILRSSANRQEFSSRAIKLAERILLEGHSFLRWYPKCSD